MIDETRLAEVERQLGEINEAIRLHLQATELAAVEHRAKYDAARALGWIDAARALLCPAAREELA